MRLLRQYAEKAQQRQAEREALARTRARVEELEEALREFEWTSDENGRCYCRACGRWAEDGHRADCWLVALAHPSEEAKT